MAKPDKITGAEIIAALGDGTVDPRDIVRLITAACEAVEQVESEHTAKAKEDAEAAERKATISHLQAVKAVHRKAEIEALKRKQEAERKATDGTVSRNVAAIIKAISTRNEKQ